MFPLLHTILIVYISSFNPSAPSDSVYGRGRAVPSGPGDVVAPPQQGHPTGREYYAKKVIACLIHLL